jgi:hypothetical protein
LTLLTLASIQDIPQRPPPAQAQAHPAQAHAHAHPPPPKPPPPLKDPVDDTFGAGFVTEVMLEVKSLIFPTTLLEKL